MSNQYTPSTYQKQSLRATRDREIYSMVEHIRLQMHETPRAERRDPLASWSYLTAPQGMAIYDGMFSLRTRFTHSLNKNHNPPRRGVIRNFSPSSRRRLLRVMNRVQLTRYAQPLWVTLTHHAEVDSDSSLRTFHAWGKRLRRRYPRMQWIWRKAPQKRGVQHYHLVVFFPISQSHLVVDPEVQRTISDQWHEVSDPDSAPHAIFGAKVERIKSRHKVKRYVASYIAKEDPSINHIRGRQWGYTRGLNLDPLLSLVLSRVEAKQIARFARRLMCSRARDKRRVNRYAKKSATLVVYADAETVLRYITEQLSISLNRPPARLDTLPD